MLLKNRQYNAERKAQSLWAKQDFEIEQLIEAVHNESSQIMQSKIDDFYLKYAQDTGLSRKDAMLAIRDFDVPKWADSAAKEVYKALSDKKFNKQLYDYNKKYSHDYFSPETNKWLKTYNAKMKISRLELLKAELEIELQKMYGQDFQLIHGHLEQAYLDELKRQAGILGNSASGASRRLQEIVNADFHGNSFSSKVWGRNGMYYSHKKAIFSSLNRMYVDMSGYRKERNFLMQAFDIKQHEAMRLLKTEASRMRTIAQEHVYKDNGFTHFGWILESGACKDCSAFANKVFPIEKFELGVTAPPIHPNDRCSTYGVIEMKRKDGTSNLDGYDKG